MRTVTIFTGTDIMTVYLLNDVTVIQPEDQISDIDKLKKKYTKSLEYAGTIGKEVIGIASFSTADITFFSDNTYNGRVWKGGFPVSGKYELY